MSARWRSKSARRSGGGYRSLPAFSSLLVLVAALSSCSLMQQSAVRNVERSAQTLELCSAYLPASGSEVEGAASTPAALLDIEHDLAPRLRLLLGDVRTILPGFWKDLNQQIAELIRKTPSRQGTLCGGVTSAEGIELCAVGILDQALDQAAKSAGSSAAPASCSAAGGAGYKACLSFALKKALPVPPPSACAPP